MEIGYVVRDAMKWEADPERTAKWFDAGYSRKLLEKAWEGRLLCSGRGLLAGEMSRSDS